jgi:hypothetical protein
MITPHAFKNKALVMVYCEKSFNWNNHTENH